MSRAWMAAALVFALAATAAMARADETAQAVPIRGDGSKIRVLDNPYGTLAWPRFAIKKLALDKKYGLDMELVPYANTPIGATIMQANGADLGLFGWNDICRIRNPRPNPVDFTPLFNRTPS